VVELDEPSAPNTVANFLRYVDGKFYDGGRFLRTVKSGNQPANEVKIEVIQPGINPVMAKKGFQPIKLNEHAHRAASQGGNDFNELACGPVDPVPSTSTNDSWSQLKDFLRFCAKSLNSLLEPDLSHSVHLVLRWMGHPIPTSLIGSSTLQLLNQPKEDVQVRVPTQQAIDQLATSFG
jgi:hypothetical protein